MSSFHFPIDSAERLESFLSFFQQGAPGGWRPNRILFRNFWFFDREEFLWHHGRLFLGGQNAAGKSTVLSMAVPLLLDGNKSEDRLNTFGGQGRHMAYYVTGSHNPDDPSEAAYAYPARISYLALEFYHAGEERYLTFGQGLHHDRASEEKTVRSWGFVIRDGRRIGRTGFDLVRENGLSLTRQELKRLLDSGGELFDTNREYKKEVNRLLFGFKDLDDFDGLIDLLLQIRRPKLTKEVRPRDVAAILTQSLPPLDEGVMQVTATSLDHIDQTTQNLERLAVQIEAARAVEKATQTLFRRMAEVAAAQFERACQQADRAAAEQHAKALALDAARAERSRALAERLACEQQRAGLIAERRELQEREGVQAAERLAGLEQEIAGRADELAELQASIRKKEELIRRLRRELAGLDESWEAERARGLEAAAEAADGARAARWETAAHWAEELRARWEALEADRPDPGLAEAVPRAALAAAARERRNQMEQVARAVAARDQTATRWEAAAQAERLALDELVRAEAAATAAANRLDDARQAAAAALYRWMESATALRLDADGVEPVAAALRRYLPGQSERLHQVFDALRPAREAALQSLDELAGPHRDRLRALAQKAGALRAERAHLDAALPEPPRSPEQERARATLAAAAIPFTPLYAQLELGPLAEETAGQVEQALAAMGLLDALVIAPDRLEEALALLAAEGLSERLLVTGEAPPSGVLIHPDGRWRHGLLAGSSAAAGPARYLGRAARERFRHAEIARLEAALAALAEQEREEQAALARLGEQAEAIRADWRRLEELNALARLEQAGLEVILCRQQVEQRQAALQEAQAEAERSRAELHGAEAALLRQYKDFPPAEGLGREELQRLAQETALVEGHFKEIHHHAQMLQSLWQNRESLAERLGAEEGDRDERVGRHEEGEVDLRRLTGRRAALQQLLERPDVQSLLDRLAEIDRAFPTLERRQSAADRAEAVAAHQVASLERELPALQERAARAAAEAANARQRLAEATQAYPTLDLHRFAPTDDAAARKTARSLLSRWTERPSLVADLEAEHVRDIAALSRLFEERREALRDYFPEMHPGEAGRLILFHSDGRPLSPFELLLRLEAEEERMKGVLQRDEAALFERHLLQEVGREVRRCLRKAKAWVDEINEKLERHPLRNEERVWLDWSPRTSEHELGGTIARQAKLLWIEEAQQSPEQKEQLRAAFQEEIRQIREQAKRGEWRADLFRERLAEVLDYRTWFRFRLFVKGSVGGRQEITDTVHNARSGSERALVLLLPLLAGLSVRYDNGSPDAPRILALDEGFAGIDALNSRQLIRFLTALELTWVVSSEKLPALTEDLPGASFYAMLREGTVVATRPFIWDGERMQDGES